MSPDTHTSRVPEYTSYPRQFIPYRWFKPLLVLLIGFAAFFILSIILTSCVLIPEMVSNPDIIQGFLGGYDTFDTYSVSGALLTLGSVVLLLPSLLIGTLIVRDRPWSSYSSSRGGWSFSVFFKCFVLSLIICGIPSVLSVVLTEGRTGVNRFTLIGFILCTILGPLQCVAEEYMCRGLLMQTFGSWIKIPVIAIILQAVIFAVMHPYNLIGVIVILIDGITFGIMAWLTKGLEASSAIHIVNNMAAFYMTGLGFGQISSEVTLSSVFWVIAINGVYILVLALLGKKFGWFDRVKKDDAGIFNAKVQARRAKKAARDNN